MLSQILHLFTNPLIFISQSYLLDQTPSLFGLSSIKLPFGAHFKFNACGFYFSFLVIYTFMLDFTSGVFHLVYLLFFYSFVPSFGRWVTRIVGVKSVNLLTLLLYLFGQFSQIIIGHLGGEDFYDWNIYQVSRLSSFLSFWFPQQEYKPHAKII